MSSTFESFTELKSPTEGASALQSLSQLLLYKEKEIKQLREENKQKSNEIRKLQSQLKKYEDVLGASAPSQRVRAQGISAESQKEVEMHRPSLTKVFPKNEIEREALQNAILENNFLRHLDLSQISEMIDYMRPLSVNRGITVIEEGAIGSEMFILQEGVMEAFQQSASVSTMEGPMVFGELAILYGCKRTASVKSSTDCLLWAIDRSVFQTVMYRSGMSRHNSNIAFLRSVPQLFVLPEDSLSRMADVLEERHYMEGEYIVRQGSRGDTFYIISSGKVLVTKNTPDGKELNIRVLTKGKFFGEKALQSDDVRTANVVVTSPDGADCLTMDRRSYEQYIKSHVDMQIDYGDEKERSLGSTDEFQGLKLSDLNIIWTLGVGGFGRVELVQIKGKMNTSYALKVMKKAHIVQTKQQDHVMHEKSIMMECKSDFIVRCYRTFKDKKYLYMLLEACLGGELWTLLRDKRSFDEVSTRFYIASVLEGLSYLHQKTIIYRDLKPENLILDAKGYIKMVDFGFSKKIGAGRKTWTFCGTPEYVAPEIILNKGHDLSADYWSLGILLFELQTGSPPFNGSDPMRVYNAVLKGIDCVEFPRKLPRASINLVKKLCRDVPSERLGAQLGGWKDIQKHKYFEGFDWHRLRQGSLAAPNMQTIASPTDASNFDEYPSDEEIPPDDLTGWDYDF